MAIEIPKFPELAFEETSHTYRLKGMVIPSVTTLMKPLSQTYYREADPDVLARAAARGTAVHEACENYALFGIDDCPPEFLGYFTGFKKWWDKKKPEVLGVECRVYHKQLMYAGTSDLICKIGDEVTLVDYKTTSAVSDMLCSVQLEGYARAWESHGFKVDSRKILHLKSNGNYAEHQYPRNVECWQVFSACGTLRNYMNKF